MTHEEAVKFSLLKWEFIVKQGDHYNSDDLVEKYPEIKPFFGLCGLCEYNIQSLPCGVPLRVNQRCETCDLNLPNIGGCCDKGHPFYNWIANDFDIKYAKQILKLIKQIKL